MNTKHDIEQDQEASSQAPGSPHTQDTLQEQKIHPAQTYPQPALRPPHSQRNRWVVVGAVILALALVFSFGVYLIPKVIPHPASQVTPAATLPAATAPTTPGIDVTPTPAPGVAQGTQAGPG